MGEPAKNINIENRSIELDNRKIQDKILGTHTDELIIGLCGPIGTKMHFVSERIEKIISEKYHYTCKKIRLADLIRQYYKPYEEFEEKTKSRYQTIQKLIEGGNLLRKEYGNDILAQLAINEITVNREEVKEKRKDDTYSSERICYIIDSIKTIEEVKLFRLIYREIFYFFGVFSNTETRVKNLEDQEIKREEVYRLIDRDSGEEINFGQKVSNTFQQSDFFLRVEKNSRSILDDKLARYFDLIFGSEIVTPTSHEKAMYFANAAASNSACLSRQVGASITNSKGEIISVGWNDVPSVGGGVYETDENISLKNNDHRCMFIESGKCYNDDEKNIISKHLATVFAEEGLINNNQINKAIEIVKKSRIKGLIEFSRAVHAEMLALIQGGKKNGLEMINGKLYCTTYPCHNCARHIVAAGITEVYYIEPYRKSLATKLHWDSITEDENDLEKVRILMFDGVSPRRYLEFFKMDGIKRKKNGKMLLKENKTIRPKNTLSLRAIPLLESQVTKELRNKKIIDYEDEISE